MSGFGTQQTCPALGCVSVIGEKADMSRAERSWISASDPFRKSSGCDALHEPLGGNKCGGARVHHVQRQRGLRLQCQRFGFERTQC